MSTRLPIDKTRIAAFCSKWKIREFSLFGSILRDDFRPESDVDVLVSFDPAATWGLFDIVEMEEELGVIFGRRVDLVEKAGLRNPFRRQAILNTRQIIYAI